MRITARALAKINWSLDVCAGRDDGYHELDMLMQRIDLSDVLTFERARWLTLTVNGRPLPVGGRNLVLQAAQALGEYVGKRLGARITLSKRIPIRAGLGGGSADCAAALIALNRLWGLRLPVDKLLEIGRALGADVPYCIAGGLPACAAWGRRSPRWAAASAFRWCFCTWAAGFPRRRCSPSTIAWAGRWGWTTKPSPRAICERDFEKMDALSGNALEAPSISLMPEIGAAMARLRAAGARVARMSGSGSAVFGVFRTAAEALRAAEALPGAIFTWTC